MIQCSIPIQEKIKHMNYNQVFTISFELYEYKAIRNFIDISIGLSYCEQ